MSAEVSQSISVEEAIAFFHLRRGPNPFLPTKPRAHGGTGFHAFMHARTEGFYSPIGEKNFRLLELKLLREQDDGIQCRMHEYSFQQAGRYYEFAAISYVCGDPNDRKTILCNGEERSIRSSLFAALRRFQKQVRDESILLWADELCINQEDLEEFSLQVSMMREIYEKAHSVLIWLGEEDEQSEHVWQLLGWISRSIEVGHAAGLGPFYDSLETEARLKLDFKFARKIIAKDEPKNWETFYANFHNPWFSRNWTFQEGTIARRAIFVRGSYAIAYGRLLGIAARLYTGDHIFGPSLAYKHDLEKLVNLRGVDRESYPSSLSRLLIGTRSRRAADPRDKVFSLLGLTGEKYGRKLQADYSLTVGDVYARAAAVCFLADQNLDLLDCTHPLADNGLPSWVPDWRCPAPETWIDCKKSFQVSEHRSPSIQIRDNCRTLLVTGFLVDCIAKVSDHRQDLIPDSHVLSRPVPDPESIHRLPNVGQGRMVPIDPGTISVSYLFNAMDKAITTPDDYTSRPAESAGRGPPSTGGRGLIIGLCNVFSTTSGRYAGLCPKNAKKGDLVVVLFGSRVPYVLRQFQEGTKDEGEGRQNTWYRLIGGCYLHGYMGGELMMLLGRKQFSECVFKIR